METKQPSDAHIANVLATALKNPSVSRDLYNRYEAHDALIVALEQTIRTIHLLGAPKQVTEYERNILAKARGEA